MLKIDIFTCLDEKIEIQRNKRNLKFQWTLYEVPILLTFDPYLKIWFHVSRNLFVTVKFPDIVKNSVSEIKNGQR